MDGDELLCTCLVAASIRGCERALHNVVVCAARVGGVGIHCDVNHTADVRGFRHVQGMFIAALCSVVLRHHGEFRIRGVFDGEGGRRAVGQAALVGQHPSHSHCTGFTASVAQRWVGGDAAPGHVAASVVGTRGSTAGLQPGCKFFCVGHRVGHRHHDGGVNFGDYIHHICVCTNHHTLVVEKILNDLDLRDFYECRIQRLNDNVVVGPALDGFVRSFCRDDRGCGVFHRERGRGAACVAAHVRGREGHRHRTGVAAIVAQGCCCGAHAPHDVAVTVVRSGSSTAADQPVGQRLVVAEVSSTLDGHVLSCSVNAWRSFVLDRDDLLCFSGVVTVVSRSPAANQQVVVVATEHHGGFFVLNVQALVHEVRDDGVEEHHNFSA